MAGPAQRRALHVAPDLTTTITCVLEAPPAHLLTLGRPRSPRRALSADGATNVSTLQQDARELTRHDREAGLPPGPRLPRIVQTAGFMFAGARFLEWARRRYGGAVYLRTLFDDGFVMVFDPALVRQVFQGSPGQLHAGEANALLGPIVGTRSVLLLDEAEHLRHRRLMLPPFHGERMRGYAEVIRAATDAAIRDWPVGTTFTLLESMQALTLSVIVHAVFGYHAGPAADELARRLRAMVDPLSRPRGLMLMAALQRLRGGDGGRGAARFAARQAAVDELLYAEIARRRVRCGPGRVATTCSRRCCSRATRTARACRTARCAMSWSPCSWRVTRPPPRRWPGRLTSSCTTPPCWIGRARATSATWTP